MCSDFKPSIEPSKSFCLHLRIKFMWPRIVRTFIMIGRICFISFTKILSASFISGSVYNASSLSFNTVGSGARNPRISGNQFIRKPGTWSSGMGEGLVHDKILPCGHEPTHSALDSGSNPRIQFAFLHWKVLHTQSGGISPFRA
jgi:hypothetical protein